MRTIQRKIPETPGTKSNGTEIFENLGAPRGCPLFRKFEGNVTLLGLGKLVCYIKGSL